MNEKKIVVKKIIEKYDPRSYEYQGKQLKEYAYLLELEPGRIWLIPEVGE